MRNRRKAVLVHSEDVNIALKPAGSKSSLLDRRSIFFTGKKSFGKLCVQIREKHFILFR